MWQSPKSPDQVSCNSFSSQCTVSSSQVAITLSQAKPNRTLPFSHNWLLLHKTKNYFLIDWDTLKLRKRKVLIMPTIDRESFHGNSFWKGLLILGPCLLLHIFPNYSLFLLEATNEKETFHCILKVIFATAKWFISLIL